MVSEFNGLNRYPATAVESGDHLSRCMVHIDANMVRAGVVSHPSMWSSSGYSEIQEPRRKNILIDYERLLREEAAPYMALLDTEKGDIGPENTWFWDITNE